MNVFKLLKLLDNLQEYSKPAVIEEYGSLNEEDKELLLSKSIYPTGQTLGFYNYSNHNLASLSRLSSENIRDEFLDYIDSYSDNVYDILDILKIEDEISNLSNEDLLEKIISLTHENSNDFLSSIYANLLSKNSDNEISFATDFVDESLELEIAIKLKQINPDLNISFSNNNISEISHLFNFNSLNNSPDCSIYDLAYREDTDYIKNILSNSNRSIITISSKFFDENSDVLNNIKNPNNLESIISLPIYYKECNLMILIINPTKNSRDFIFIDESESLIHKNNDYDYSYAFNEIIPNIALSFNEFKEYENALILPISLFIEKKSLKDNLESINSYTENDDYSKRRVYKSEVDKLISLQEQQVSLQEEMSRYHQKNVDLTEYRNRNLSLEEITYFKNRQPLENLLYKNEKKLLDEDVIFVNLRDIADLISINHKNDKDSILVAACKNCRSKLVNYNHDIDSINPDEYYIEIDNISPDILKQYLYTYLNSLNGLDEIRYFSKKNYMITTEQLGFVKIPVLKHTTQLELVDAVRESEEFFKSIDLLKKDFQSNILDYKHVLESINELRGDIDFSENGDVNVKKSMRHAYADMIWPLASSYLQATKGGFETVEKKDNYLVLFEFVCAFNFIILLSGLPDNVYQKCKWEIWSHRNKNIYKDMTFGKWVILSQNIAKVYRNNNFTSKLDELLFNKISSNKILKILDKTKDFRNEEHHSAQSNKYEAEQTLNELNIYLKDMFEILEVYSNYKLIYVLESNDLKHKVISLNGACAPPLYDTLTFDEKLKNNRLYLYNPKNNKKLLIKDNLMKFTSLDDEKKHWALFLYDSCDYKEYNAFYKCYQSKQYDLKESIYDFKEDIIG